jgi:dienelactone hydrolase
LDVWRNTVAAASMIAMVCFSPLTRGQPRAPMVDASKLAAIGFCFGGMPALDLARSGAPLLDVVTFHGSLGTPNPESNRNIKGHVLVLHGAADPIVNAEAVTKFEKEM